MGFGGVWLASYNGSPAAAGSAWRLSGSADAKNSSGAERRPWMGPRRQHRTPPRRQPVMARTGSRTPFRNNARLVLLSTGGALGLLVVVQVLLRKSRDFSPDFLASVLLYGLTVLNISLLLVLLLVLGRNLVRVIMERRRGVLGARFRMRLVIVFVLMAAAPALLLMVVGSD